MINPTALLDDPAAVSRATRALTASLLQTHERCRGSAGAPKNAVGYLLIDPTLRNVLDDSALGALLTAAKSQYYPLPRRHHVLRTDQQPILVAPQWHLPATRKLIEQVFRACIEDWHPNSYSSGAGQRIGGWLFSRAPVNLVANHLGALMVQRPPADLPNRGGKRHLLRVHDPLVLSGLWQIATLEQSSALLGPIDAWCILGADLHLRTLTPQQVARYFDGTLHFSVEQWQDILALEFIHRAALLSKRLFQIEPRRAALLAAMRRAKQWRLLDKDDLRLFAHHAVTVHPAFDAHPRVRAALALRHTQGYGGATETLSAADWHTVATEMNQSYPPEALTA